MKSSVMTQHHSSSWMRWVFLFQCGAHMTIHFETSQEQWQLQQSEVETSCWLQWLGCQEVSQLENNDQYGDHHELHSACRPHLWKLQDGNHNVHWNSALHLQWPMVAFLFSFLMLSIIQQSPSVVLTMGSWMDLFIPKFTETLSNQIWHVYYKFDKPCLLQKSSKLAKVL